jgi:hypothetical protein
MDKVYEELVEAGRKVANVQWELGDLALQVETKYGEETLEQYAEDIGVLHTTLSDYRWVASRYQKTTRAVNVSWTVHRVFAAQDDRAKLVKKKLWTYREAKEEIQKRKDKEDEILDSADKFDEACIAVSRGIDHVSNGLFLLLDMKKIVPKHRERIGSMGEAYEQIARAIRAIEEGEGNDVEEELDELWEARHPEPTRKGDDNL